MKLTHAEIHNPLWIKLKEHIESRMDAHRRKNDGDLDDIATARLRGRIAELKSLLDLENPEPAQDAEHGSE
jgi:hypothetical protein